VIALAAPACSGGSGAGGGGSLSGGYVGAGQSPADGEAASGADGFDKFDTPGWDASSSDGGDGADAGSDDLSTGSTGAGGSGSTGAGSSGASGSSSGTGAGTTGSSGSTTSGSSGTNGSAQAITGAGDNKVFVLGDSVLLAAETMLPTQMTGWDVTVDAKVSRRMDAGITVLEQRRSEIGAVAVVHLCTNYAKGEGFAGKLDRVMELLDGVKRVVLVTCAEWSPGQPEANAVINAAPQKWSNVRVADWATIAHNAGHASADGIHLLPPGVIAISKLIADQVGPAPAFAGPSIPSMPTMPAPTVPDFSRSPDDD
jgi:hypothetical protein